MSVVDLDQLLAPISDDAPCGPDLRGDPEFREIEDAPAEFSGMKPPELLKVVRKCTDMLARTKDQMPAIVAIQAAIRAGDISTTTALIGFVTRIADDQWDNFHPGPAEEMAIGRVNELSALSRPAAMLLPLQRLGIATMPPPATTEFTATMLAMALEPVMEWTSEDEEKLNGQVQSGAITAAAARAIKPNQEAARQLRGIMIAIADEERQKDATANTLPSGFDPSGARPVALALRAGVASRRDELQALSDQIYTLGEVYERKMGDSPSLGPVLAQLRTMIETAAKFLSLFPDPATVAEASAEGGDAPAAASGDGGAAPAA
uniref:type VI secretion system ImpA family N-terminal domain-containing protein n=1 Tax=Sandarakinorhabdus oryzae TaxID=2675220 RepID=UPI0018CC07C2